LQRFVLRTLLRKLSLGLRSAVLDVVLTLPLLPIEPSR
jgi:hypothetical protein